MGRLGTGRIRAGAVALAVVAGSGAPAALAGSSTSARAGRPNLVVTSVSAPPTVEAGSLLKVKDTTKATGRKRAPSSYTGFYLSHDKAFGVQDQLLAARKLGALRP